MSRFIAFDVETPNSLNNRMSAIGITVIENDAIIDEFYSLVNPETCFDAFNVQLTGISEKMVRNAPTFSELWSAIEPMMSGGLLVAHNAVFDLSVLKTCLRDYGIEWKPYVRYVCTVQTGRRVLPGMSHRLNVLCDYYGINLNHHHAASDSHACAEILLRYIEDGADIRQHIKTYSFREEKKREANFSARYMESVARLQKVQRRVPELLHVLSRFTPGQGRRGDLQNENGLSISAFQRPERSVQGQERRNAACLHDV